MGDAMSEKTMPITGGCLCGAVRYEASEAPFSVCYCHCRLCQQTSGSVAAVGAVFRKETIRFTRGEPKLYKSSEIAERGFCARSGSRLVYRPFSTDWISIDIGSLDHPEDWPPNEHRAVESQLPWLTIADDLPRTRTEDQGNISEFKAALEQGEE